MQQINIKRHNKDSRLYFFLKSQWFISFIFFEDRVNLDRSGNALFPPNSDVIEGYKIIGKNNFGTDEKVTL